MADQALLMLTKDVRGRTIEFLETVTEEQARWAPPGLQNNILWHAGHGLIVMEHLVVAPCAGRPPVDPPGWFDKFSWMSRPATVKEWPALREVREKLTAQFDQLLMDVGALTEQQLAAPCPPAYPGRDFRGSIIQGLHDEAQHQGEMWLLMKMQTKGKL